MALEDAAALEMFFAETHFNAASYSVEQRLQLLNQFRMPLKCVM